MNYDVDLFVIGAGSGGVRAARMAAGFGAKVVVAEERYLGGTCVNVGCVPKKLFVYASHFSEDFHDAEGFGWNMGKAPDFDWATLRDNKTKEIERLNGIYRRLLENAGCEIIKGRARVTGPNSVAINGKTITAGKILLAVGGWPDVPEFEGSEHAITSNETFYLDKLPKKILIVGGGYIAVEFAGIYQGLGVDTTLIYRGPKILRHFDTDISEIISEELLNKNIKLKLESNIRRIEKNTDGQLSAHLNDGSTMQADAIMYATGRKPMLHDLGLDTVNVELDSNGKIQVNEEFQTSEVSIYAVGDIIDTPELTPVALEEGMAFAYTQFGNQPRTVDYDDLATAVFCQPNIATVGLNEQDAHDTHELCIYKSRFRPMKHTLSGNPEKSFMKLIVDKESDEVLGIHMIGPDAGEIIQGLAVAMKAGATKAVFDATIGIHPTAAEEFVTMRTPSID
ncbi:MAG: glutathione-disulfide reductase [Gammaproteobacteria bacterium]|nr:glutathione-disulfide reductase [Gammaproteobacteria bacterium]NNC96648.1 glutathione-disulfide reductase [Gammaproteobacteria bacterium]